MADDDALNREALLKYVKHNGDLTADGYVAVALGLAVMQFACYRRSRFKGWWDGRGMRNFGEAVALIHSELSEALEAYREGDDMRSVSFIDENGRHLADGDVSFMPETAKPVGVASEFADVLIRLFDLCQGFHVPLAEAFLAKHRYNGTRPHRHGGKRC